MGDGPTVGSRVMRGAEIGGKVLIAFRGGVRMNTTEDYRMAASCKLVFLFHVILTYGMFRLFTCHEPLKTYMSGTDT